MIFVDTGAWYAAYVPSDPKHDQVGVLIDNAEARLFTTDYVLAETLTLLRARGEYERAILLGQDLLNGKSAELIYLSPDDIARAFVYFSTYRDKQWSFVDCSSLVVMQRLQILEAISLDRHFREMPGISVSP